MNNFVEIHSLVGVQSKPAMICMILEDKKTGAIKPESGVLIDKRRRGLRVIHMCCCQG